MATVTASTSMTFRSREAPSAKTAMAMTLSAKVSKIYVTARTAMILSRRIVADSGYMAGRRYRR